MPLDVPVHSKLAPCICNYYKHYIMTEECAEKTVYLMADRKHTQVCVLTHTHTVGYQRQGLTFKNPIDLLPPAKHIVFSVSPNSTA